MALLGESAAGGGHGDRMRANEIKLLSEFKADAAEMRAAYCDALIKCAENDPRIVALDCDMSTSMGTKPFAARFPGRAFNLGIQEANVCGVAAGLSAAGFIPFMHTFSVFITRRIFDQVYLSCGYGRQNVKLIGGDAGVSTALNGGTHMPFEDVGIMRCIPGITILEPADAAALSALVPQIAAHNGLCYMRMRRTAATRLYADGSEFRIGAANVLREGADVTIIAAGMMVHIALLAASELSKDGIGARVVDMFTIKPIDAGCIVESAQKTGAVVTAENHNIIGGLGSAVAEVLAERAPVPMERVGVMDEYGEVGQVDYLMERFGLTAANIVKKAKRAIQRKIGGGGQA